MLASVIIMIALACLLAWGVNQWFSDVQTLNAVNIALVIPEDSAETDLVVDMIEEMESVSSICTFAFVDPEQMMEGLVDGRYHVGVELTQDFYDDVNNGINTPLTVYFSADQDMSKAVFKELLYAGISYVRTTESAIYSVVDIGKHFALKETRRDTEDTLSEFYVFHILGRASTFDSVVLSPTGEVNLNQYYMVVAILLFLLLGSLLFGFLYEEREDSMLRVLSLRGITPRYASFVRFFVMWLYCYLTTAVFYIGSCIVCHFLELDIIAFRGLAFLCMIPVTLSMTAFGNLVYSLAKNKVAGTLILLGINIVMLIVCGGIVPLSYFPEPVQVIGKCLPLHFWMNDLQKAYYGQPMGIGVLWSLLFAAVCFVIAMAVTQKRLLGFYLHEKVRKVLPNTVKSTT